MRIDVLTLFPEMFPPILGQSILRRAAEKGHVSYHLHQLRDYTTDPHRKVDDRPFGGGPGMVLMCQPVIDAVLAIEALAPARATRVVMCPGGSTFTQSVARELLPLERLLLICGHYEAFDQRIIDILKPRLVSIGDYVLSGGELPAMVVIDAVVRLIPGVLGHAQGAQEESFSPDAEGHQALEHPQYTRPRIYQGLGVPEILFSGDHAAIAAYRAEEARKRTLALRPDLLP
jgi:tRNA (guanine37-N1)-methyltransferase